VYTLDFSTKKSDLQN